MLSFIIRRLLALIPQMLIAALVVFVLTSLLPGDAAIARAGGESATPELIAQYREQLGLDKPLVTRFFDFVVNAATGDLGISFSTNEPVTDILMRKVPVTLSLVLLSFLVALLIALPLGIVAALHPNGVADRVSLAIATSGIAIPNFWFAILLVLLFSLTLGWLPATGYVSITENPGQWFLHLLLPAITLGHALAAELTRQLRASLGDHLRRDYVRTMRSVGLSEVSVVGKHALRSALGPAVTTLGLQVPIAIGSAVVVEAVFDLPGIGSQMVQAVFSRDIQVLQGVILFTVLLVVVASFLTDLAYALINPKVRVQ
ncbi:ABC transporter permease [Chryseoglobus sp. 28M-23]|uniref:ABC transporter permease n=1 Tax=Chryseoglobus sp. 28M-23 TaxID=2772253 RepID=UPI0017466EDD|nr:ABC transporter permease [Chryseoglobus sp. 28M-23]QOD94388.1 ABC transporter permease [Chryseoglobus sp. 28M-23]